MVVRKFKKSTFEAFYEVLMERAKQEPYEASCIVDVTLNTEHYALKLLPEANRVVVLQAVRSSKGAQAHTYELITQSGFLINLFELLLYQWIH